jgi:hypothetical protein
MINLAAVIDPAQLARIEATHRGFLYQHAYAAVCMLAIRGTEAEIVVEHDEDVELLWPDRHVYVQVKYRKHGLSRAEAEAILEAFAAVRDEHANGARATTPVFVIVTNARPKLTDEQVAALPADVHLSYPGHHDVAGLSQPQVNETSALRAVEAEAANLSSAAISPASLALKLVGYAQLLATGADGHRVDGAKVAQLCELIVEQLQNFPEPPSPYRPQRDEPAFEDGGRVRIIVGFSGAGKTAWAARRATTTTLPVAYFDVTAIPGPSVAGSLARELAARFVDDPAERAVLFANDSGVNVLRAIARRANVAEAGAPAIVLDNAHLLEPGILATVAGALAPMRVLVLMQPPHRLPVLEQRLGAAAESLAGWDDDTIALEFAERDAHADPQTVARIRGLTGALPLLVATAAQLAQRSFGGDPAAMCDALERGAMVEQTAQNALLEQFTRSLSVEEQDALALLALSEVPLTAAEATEVVRVRLDGDGRGAAAMRALSSSHILQSAGAGLVKIHEAFRPLALEGLAVLGPDVAMAGRLALRDAIARNLSSRDVDRLRFWMALLAQIGDTDTLTSLALDEMIHQIGGPDVVRATLEEALESEALDASSRFDILDALAFWDSQRGEGDRFADFVGRMEQISETFEVDQRQRVSLTSKQMLRAADVGDLAEFEAAFERGMLEARGNVLGERVLRHNHAQSLARMGFKQEGAAAASELADEYLAEMGLTQDALNFRQPDELADIIGDVWEREVELRHAADALHVVARTMEGRDRGLKLIQAVKLYKMAGAMLSVLRVSQDAADAFVAQRDYVGARMMMEQHLLGDLRLSGLVDQNADVQGQYAVILAYTGEIAAARKLMASLRAYDIPPAMRAQLDGQRAIIEHTARAFDASDGRPRVRETPKVGRNDVCPCGSGLKYKRCHGAG